MKKLRELYVRFKLWRSMRGMSELGREVYLSFQLDKWVINKYTIDCKQSGIEIWIANSWNNFRFYKLPHGGMGSGGELEQIKFFNKQDQKFLHAYVEAERKKIELSPAQVAINIIRASRMKDD